MDKTNPTDHPRTYAAMMESSDTDGAHEVCDLCAKLEEENARLLHAGWQPIKTAPRTGEILATGMKYGDVAKGYHNIVITQYDGVGWKTGHMESDGKEGYYLYLTHWMPLPALPNA